MKKIKTIILAIMLIFATVSFIEAGSIPITPTEETKEIKTPADEINETIGIIRQLQEDKQPDNEYTRLIKYFGIFLIFCIVVVAIPMIVVPGLWEAVTW